MLNLVLSLLIYKSLNMTGCSLFLPGICISITFPTTSTYFDSPVLPFFGGLTLYMYCHGWGPSTCIIFFLKLHFFLNMFIHRVIQLISISHLQYLAICFILITFFFRKLLWDHSWLNLKKKKAKIETEILQVGYIFVVKCSWFLMKKKTQALLFVLKFVIDFN